MRARARSLLLVLAVLASLGTSVAMAQDTSDGVRPTVGLVLSGGGARGLAHVGVLQVLEELRVPVDIVTGTSMGAIVGGLYASGLPPDSMRIMIEDIDWERILADTPPRESLSSFRRAAERHYPVEIEIGLSLAGLRLPSGLISGHDLGLLLRRYTLPVAAVEDFSRLPIPYAAAATDLSTGQRVVLDGGDLVEAMRASMAIPVVFSPVERDGRLLVDGGLIDNLPVELARAMGADVVIAVDASSPLLEEEELRSILGISSQLVTLASRESLVRQLPLADLVIELGFERIGIFDFRDADSIVSLGEAAARKQARALSRWSLSVAEYEARRSERARRRPAPPPAPGRLSVDAPEWVDERLALSRVDPTLRDTLDADLAEDWARNVHAIGEFERVGYDLSPGGEHPALVLAAHAKPRGPNLLRLGIDLATDSGGETPARIAFEGVAGYIRTRIGSRAAELRADFRAGTTTGIETTFRQPLDFAGRWFVEPSLQAVEIQRPVYVGEAAVTEYETRRVMAGVEIGHSIGLSTEGRVGLARGRETSEHDPAIDGLGDRFPEIAEDTAEIRASLIVDRVDSINLPRRGAFARVAARVSREELGADRSWARFSTEARGYWSRGPTTVFASAAGGASSPASDLPVREEFLLGGFGSLSGFGDGELRGEAFSIARAGWLHRIVEIPPALRAVLAGGWIEAGDAWDPSLDEEFDARVTLTAAVGAETIAGPIFFAWSRAEGGRGRLTFSIGRSP